MKHFFVALIVFLSFTRVTIAQDITPESTVEPVPEYWFEFPIEMPSHEQLIEAINCFNTAMDVVPDSACDYANQVYELAEANNGDLSVEALELARNVAEMNPLALLNLELLRYLYNSIPLVSSPDFAEQPVIGVDLHYTFSGLGDSLTYDFSIEDANGEPVISGDVQTSAEETIELPESVDPEIVQGLGSALTDLLPIGQTFSEQPCWDFYPDWEVTLTFEDSTQVTMETNETNIVGIGGPWQTVIDEQPYVQYSAAFPIAIVNLLETMELPLGQTAAMGCGGIAPLWQSAFPRDQWAVG